MTDIPSLDRPVWSSLKTNWAGVAEGCAPALRLHPDYGPFGGALDESAESLEALAALIPQDGELWLVQKEIPPANPHMEIVRTALVHQMVAEQITAGRSAPDAVPLIEADAAEMRALALLTEPGPYASLTHRLGSFVGVKREGKLVAMAGERMRCPGYTEVSGVCTHPDFRGHGLAGGLMRIVAQKILDRGETPFLHAYASNTAGIALHESVGFRLRTPVNATVLKHPDGRSA